jgi:hypothetical protein
MTTNQAIKELASAVRLLAWYVGKMAVDQESQAELNGIRNAMQRIQQEHDASDVGMSTKGGPLEW